MSAQPLAPRRKAKIAFVSAIALLFVSGIAMDITIVHLLRTERWVLHTMEVQAALGEVDSSLVRAGRAHTGYLATGSQDFLAEFDKGVTDVHASLQRLSNLTQDNPKQQAFCEALEKLIRARVAAFQRSIELRKSSGDNDQEAQTEIVRQSIPLSTTITAVTSQMRDEERGLLRVRERASQGLFSLTVIILCVSLITAIFLFLVHYRLLRAELRAREEAEQVARNTEESLRRLTIRLLQLQDEERRKFSRELHDSLGQYLAGVKMNLQMYAGTQPKHRFLLEAIQLLDQSIIETRTISHLLHPPLLDEAGFSSAAKWYIEGFAKRSGIEISFQLPDQIGRLPRPVELGLFRVLQEGLNNIHRHSGSSRAEITLELSPNQVVLKVRDFGKGIPEDVLTKLRTDGLGIGVGLAGMRERVRELGGRFDVQSSPVGTSISVSLPLTAYESASGASAAD
jgi:signal transduction histidine kinase